MLSKEEIEKAKERLNNPKKEDLIEIIRIFKRNGIENYCIAKNETIQTLLQYIDQIEQENEALKKGQASLMTSRKKWKDRAYKLRKIFNKQAKMIDVMAKEINEADTGYNDYCNSTKECTGEECENCIKKYFEKKVEEE